MADAAPARPSFVVDPDAGELTIGLAGPLPAPGWEDILQRLEQYLTVVDVIVLDGAGWESAVGRRIELVLREALPAQGVAVMHAGDARLAAFRAASRPARRRRGETPAF